MKNPQVQDIVEQLQASIDEMTRCIEVAKLFDEHLDAKWAEDFSREQLNKAFKSVYVRLDALQIRLAKAQYSESPGDR